MKHIGQIYERKAIYSIESVLSKQIDPHPKLRKIDVLVDFDGDVIKMNSHRYWTFARKGVVCVDCGLTAKFFAKERSNGIGYHFNLYGINELGEEVLFTKDHHIPKSKGGKDHIDNYDPMCYDCNYAKSNTLPEGVHYGN